MTRITSNEPRSDYVKAVEGLLAWLGLPSDAKRSDVHAIHQHLLTVLDSASPALRPWAKQQMAAAEAALLLLPETEDSSEAKAEELAPATSEDVAADRTTTDSTSDSTADPALDTTEEDGDLEAMDQPDFENEDGAPRRVRNPFACQKAQTHKPWFRPLLLTAVVLGVIFGVYQMGDPPASPSKEAAAAADAAHGAAGAKKPLNQALVDELRSRVEKDSKDVVAMRSLAEAYYQASDFDQAAAWQQRIIDVEPNDVDAHLALGVARFNMGQLDKAEAHFAKAAEIDPRRAEVHYNLGFLYLSKNPPDMDKVQAAWQKVIDLDSNSPLAKNASAHLERLRKPGGNASAHG